MQYHDWKVIFFFEHVFFFFECVCVCVTMILMTTSLIIHDIGGFPEGVNQWGECEGHPNVF